eukprot:maker-scaffold_36-snap-gene-2.7-mRNA-1 protein AED:0.27 eAED:0.28 QI:0/0/0/1/0.5/0.66/3/0/795
MKGYLLNKVEKGSWIMPETNKRVKCIESDVMDVMFDNNVRVTLRIYFANKELTQIQRFKLVEVIKKMKIGENETFQVFNHPRKQVFDLRFSSAVEEELSPKNNEISQMIEYAKSTIQRAYTVSSSEKMFGNSFVTFKPQTTTTDLKLFGNFSMKRRRKLEFVDPLINYAKDHLGHISINFVRQLKWSLLTPNKAPSLGSELDTVLRNFDPKSLPAGSMVYLTNEPGRIELRDKSTWVCASSQYIVSCKFDLLEPVLSPFAFSNEVSTDFKIIYFRKKRRRSFVLREHVRLDMTRSQQSLNPASVWIEPNKYEIEMETLLSNKYLREVKKGEKSMLNAVELTLTILSDVATFVYGVQLTPPLPSLEDEIWKNARNTDRKRFEALQKIKLNGTETSHNISQPSNQALAANFYNTLDRSKSSRSESRIYHMRCCNNFCKSVLINKTVAEVLKIENRELKILDLACGKGADLPKFQNAIKENKTKIDTYVGIDIAKQSLVDFEKRFDGKDLGFQFALVAADLGSVDLVGNFEAGELQKEKDEDSEMLSNLFEKLSYEFDLISMQFALHYMFQSKERATNFFSFVSRLLSPDGRFFGTTVDSRQMVYNLLHSEADSRVFSLIDEEVDSAEVCKVEFEKETLKRLFSRKRARNDVTGAYAESFGLQYTFQLKDKEQQDAVNAPEWLVPLLELVKIGFSHGLFLCKCQNFIFCSLLIVRDKLSLLAERMNVWNIRGNISKVEWELICLYTTFEFRKMSFEEVQSLNLGTVNSMLRESIPDFDKLDNEVRMNCVKDILKYKSH